MVAMESAASAGPLSLPMTRAAMIISTVGYSRAPMGSSSVLNPSSNRETDHAQVGDR